MLKPPLCPSSSPAALSYQIYLQWSSTVCLNWPHLFLVAADSPLPRACVETWRNVQTPGSLPCLFPVSEGKGSRMSARDSAPAPSQIYANLWILSEAVCWKARKCPMPRQLESSVTAFHMEATLLRGIPGYPWNPEGGEENI